jgi:NhaP-type Na+/H+ or K+/H+ antiporter
VNGFAEAVGSESAEHVVELILAVLLFVDACEVRGGVFGGEGRTIARLVLIALPLSLLAVVSGIWILPNLNVFVLLVIACVVMPTDFAPAAALLRSPRIPPRIRQILNVESGYNDGLVSPVFAMALAAAVVLPTLLAAANADSIDAATEAQLEEHFTEFVLAFVGAVPATLVAIIVGVAFGGLFGFLARLAVERGWASAAGIRYVMLIVPPRLRHGHRLGGRGQRVRRGVRRRHPVSPHAHARHDRAHDPAHRGAARRGGGNPAANLVWFVLGAMTVVVILDGFDLRLLLVAVLALTVFRVIPVYLSMLGSSLPWRERTMIGFIGPRGTATIVFGLLAFNKLPDAESFDVLAVMVFTVVGSILMHGVIAPRIVNRGAMTARDLSPAVPPTA